jgi:hypothetical protein
MFAEELVDSERDKEKPQSLHCLNRRFSRRHLSLWEVTFPIRI